MSDELSLAEQLAGQPDLMADFLKSLTAAEREHLAHNWRFWGRPKQQPPDGAWFIWGLITGRGWGKNRTAREWYRTEVERRPGGSGFLAARTFADVRDTILYHPESGFLVDQRPWNPCTYVKSERALSWRNGFTARFYTSEKPDQGRGPQHEIGFADEFATWRRDRDEKGFTLLDNLLLGLRQMRRLPDGSILEPRCVLGSTPRPVKSVSDLVAEASAAPQGRVRIARGSIWENERNLAPVFLEQMRARFAGTRAGRQELEGELLEAIEGALWSLDVIDALRLDRPGDLVRVVIGADPAVSAVENSNRTGIVAAGLGVDRHLYMLRNRSCVASPLTWARRLVDLYHELDAYAVVAEVNNGGDLVESNIRTVDPDVRVIKVHATRGKAKRAEPVAALYEQGRAHHCGDPQQWAAMEAQMCATTPAGYEGDGSPDDMDAMVWAATELLQGGGQHYGVW